MRGLNLLRGLTVAGILALVLGPAAAVGQDIPTPPDNWWTQLKVDDSATFEMNMGTFGGTIKITITELVGSNITFRTETAMGGLTLPVEEQTVDAAVYDPNQALATMQSMGPGGAGQMGGVSPGQVGAGADVDYTQVGEETIEVSGKDLECIIYEIESGDQMVKSWYSPQLPPVFMAGSVRVEMEMPGMGAGTVRLTEFTGNPLK